MLHGVSDHEALEQVRRAVQEHLKGTGAKVYLFGSRLTGGVHAASDLDIAISPAEPLAVGLLSSIRETLEESTVPFSVDVVDLSEATPAFRRLVEREGALWIG